MNLKLSILGAAIAMTVTADSIAWNAQTNTLTMSDEAGTGPPQQGTGPGGIPTRWWNGDGNGPANLVQWTFDNNYPYYCTIDGSRAGYGTKGPSTDYSSTVEPGYVVMTGSGLIPAAEAPPVDPGNPPGGGGIPPGTAMGHDTIPCPNGQVKKSYSQPMVLELPNQPAGKPGMLGLMRTAPQIGGDLEAGPATIEWIDQDTGNPMSMSGDAPVTAWYGTDQKIEGALFYAKVGSTIRVTVPDPLKPWFIDYRTPNA